MKNNKAVICNVNPKVGDEGYLVCYVGGEIDIRFELEKERPFTVPGGIYKDYGFLGSYKNCSKYSYGKVRLTIVEPDKFNNWFVEYETIPTDSN